jgi:hypothetical protein
MLCVKPYRACAYLCLLCLVMLCACGSGASAGSDASAPNVSLMTAPILAESATSTPGSTAIPTLQPVVSLRPDGALLVEGQPFFPFGFALYTRYGEPGFGPATLQTLSEHGFNTIHAPIRDNYHDLLAAADQHGIRLLAEIYPYELDEAGIRSAISWVKDQPGLLAYAIADDVDDGDYYTPQLVAEVNHIVKQIDSRHPTYISGYRPDQIAAFMQSADLIAMQSYPIGKTYAPLARIDHVNTALAQTIALARPFQRPIIANLQAFAWPEQRAPSADELRNMTYQALVNNVRGIIYYTYDDGYWRIEEHPAVLEAVQQLAPEIARLAPVLLDGIYTPLVADQPAVLAAQWQHLGGRYLIAVNTAADAASVRISLPDAPVGQLTPLFAERPAGMQLTSRGLEGTLTALAVHVYQLDK